MRAIALVIRVSEAGCAWPLSRRCDRIRPAREPFDVAHKVAFCEAIRVGATVEVAAQRAGFAASTAYRALNRDACFAASYAEARRLRREAVAVPERVRAGS
jgi:hypothetical protein